MKKLVIFDLDGVLVETRDMHYHLLNKSLKSYGYPEIEYTDHLNNYNGLPTKVKLEKMNIPEKDRAGIQRLKQILTSQEISAFVNSDPRIHELIMNLYSDHILVLASNAIRATAVNVLRKLNINSFFSEIYSAEEFKPKPDPDMYLSALENFNVHPNNCLIIEDSPIGLEAAAKTHCKILKVSGPDDLSLPLILKALNEIHE